ncbi:MAG: lipopolysaccharide biosynthesis protein [Candidatus Polarisedimenticolia bacterium]
MTRLALGSGFSYGLIMVLEHLTVLIRTLVLSRLLEPHEFGLMGMAFVALLAAEFLSQTGFRSAIIQRQGDPSDYLDTNWWVSLARGLLLAAGLFLAAPLIGWYFREPGVVPLVRMISLALLLRGMTSPGWILLERDLRLGRFATPHAIGTFVDMLVTIYLAFLWRSAWSMVIGFVTGTVIFVVLTFVLAPYRPRFRVSLARIREMREYGKHIFRSDLATFFGDVVDRLAVGRLLTTHDLGLYTFGHRLATFPTQIGSLMVVRVLFPAFSRIQHEPQRVREAFLRLMRLVSAVIFPVATGLIAAAPIMIPVLFGEKWLEMLRAFQTLCVFGLVSALGLVCASIGQSLGRPAVVARATFLRLVILCALIVPATSRFGINGAATVAAGAALASMLFMLSGISKLVNVRARSLAAIVALPALSCALMGAATWLAELASASLPGAARLILLIGTGAAAYLSSLWMLDRWSGGATVTALTSLRR